MANPIEEKDIKKDVIDGVVAQLKADGSFATRDEVHNEIMDALKTVVVTPNRDADTEFTPKQRARAKQAWYRQVIGRGLPWEEEKAWSTDVSHSGKELVPTVVANDIVAQLDNTPFRKAVTQYPYSPKGTLPYENALSTAYRMTTRGTAVSESAGTHAEFSYSTYGLMAWMALDNKLAIEANPDTTAYIENTLVRAIMRKEMIEWTLGAGSGSEQMTGMQTTATGVNCVSGHLTVAALTSVDWLALFWGLDSPYAEGAALIAPNATLAALAALNTTTQLYLNVFPGGAMQFFGGYPVIRMPATSFDSPATTKVCAYFGNPKAYYLFQDGPIAIGTTNAGKTATLADQTIVVAKCYTDGVLSLPQAMMGLKYLT